MLYHIDLASNVNGVESIAKKIGKLAIFLQKRHDILILFLMWILRLLTRKDRPKTNNWFVG